MLQELLATFVLYWKSVVLIAVMYNITYNDFLLLCLGHARKSLIL